MQPELESAFRELASARKTKSEQRQIRDDASAAFDKANREEDRAILKIAQKSGIKPGQDLFFDVDGIRWHVEHAGGNVTVKRATPGV